MNAPVPAPKDPLSSLLILTGLGLAAVAILKLDDVLLELKDRVWKLENPVDDVPGAKYDDELVPEPTPAVKRGRPRGVKDTEA